MNQSSSSAEAKAMQARVRRAQIACLLAAATVAVAGCGGGGGGGGSSPPVSPLPPPPSPPPPPPPPSPPPGPSPTSSEFTRNWGLGAIHAEVPFGLGASGTGITVAVIDTGVDGSRQDLVGAVSSDSVDIVGTHSRPIAGDDNHGTLVAGVIAARFNSFGTVGVAYNSTILAIRADSTGSCTTGDNKCSFSDTNTAAGLIYAVDHGARVVNMSLGGPDPDGITFQNALAYAVAHDVVVVVAAGNESAADPSWPARWAGDARYKGLVIAVGAIDKTTGDIASFSNKAGTSGAQDDFLMAPGSQVITDCSGTTCTSASGTSLAAPHVAGAVALLLQYFPTLTGRQAVAILMRTARDMGASGTDSTYGVGAMDLTNAFAPLGATALSLADGTTIYIGTSPGTAMSGAYGDALTRTGALKTAVHDSFDRLFVVNAGSQYPRERSQLVDVAPSPELQQAGFDLDRDGAHLSIVSSRPVQDTLQVGRQPLLWTENTQPADVSMTVTAGRLSFSTWAGTGATQAFARQPRDAFSALARPEQAVRADYALTERWSFSAEAGSGKRQKMFSPVREDGSRYALAAATFHNSLVDATISGGRMSERLGPLGSFIDSDSAFALPSETRFMGVATRWALPRGMQFDADFSYGRTTLQGRFLSSDALSSSWRLGLDAPCWAFGAGQGCSSLHLSLSQPLRVEQGHFDALLADVPAKYTDPTTWSWRHFDATPSGREMDLRLGADRSLGRATWVSLAGVAAFDQSNVAGQKTGYGLVANLKTKF